MKVCAYCGSENDDDKIHCRDCGTEQFVFPAAQSPLPLDATRRSNNTTEENRNSIPSELTCSRQRLTSALLLIVGVVYLAMAAINLWTAGVTSTRAAGYQRYPQYQQQLERTRRILCWGGFWNTIVGGLCVGARAGMKPRAPVAYATCAFMIATAICITARTWVVALLRGGAHMAWIEPMLVWPCLVYALLYAHNRSKRTRAA